MPGFVTDWAGGADRRRLSDLEQVLNDRPDTGQLRRKLLNIGPLVDSRNGNIPRSGSL
jgi:hypothetical protein